MSDCKGSLLRRFALVAGAVGALVLLLCGVAVYALLGNHSLSREVARRDIPGLRTVEDLRGSFFRLQIAEHRYLTTADPVHVALFEEITRDLRGQMQALLADPLSETEREALLALLPPLTRHGSYFRQRRAILTGQSQPEASEYQQVAQAEDRLLGEIEARISRIVDERERQSETKLARMSRQAAITMALVLLTLLAALSGLFVIFLSGRAVTRRVTELAAQIAAMGQVGANNRVPVRAPDEIGRLATVFNDLQQRIEERTAAVKDSLLALAALDRQKTVLLNHINQGLVTLDLQGRMSSQCSAVLGVWLGPYEPGQTFWSLLADQDGSTALSFQLGWEMMMQGFMPLELTVDQMPRRIVIGERHLRIEYTLLFSPEPGLPIVGDLRETLDGVMLVISDVTAQIQRERLEAEQRELMTAIDRILHNRDAFRDFFLDAGELVHRLAEVDINRPAADTRRLVHTLKGNSGIYGLTSLASFCHDVETRMADQSEPDLLPEDRLELDRRWRALSEMFGKLIGASGNGQIEIEETEVQAVLQALESGSPRGELVRRVRGWRMQPTAIRLQHFADQLRDLARRLGKSEVAVVVEDHGLRLDPAPWLPFWSAFTHVVRNTVDHGLETTEERVALEKPAEALVRLCSLVRGEEFVIRVSDDGRGIAWERVADKARARGLPAATPADLVEALFGDGISTRDEVSELSGRGVGLGAVREACVRLGGAVRVASQPGRGTTFEFVFSRRILGIGLLTPEASRPTLPARVSAAPH